MAVENGRAGIWPERVRRMVQSGDFANIDVINSHHYAGTDSPEVNVINHNMGFAGDETVMSFFDQLRAAKKARFQRRQSAPTLAHRVRLGHQSRAGCVARSASGVFERAFMMLAAAGTEKGFWFFDLDADKANQFFDGCGLFTYDQLPKLSYAAFAGLTQILPKPQYMGMISAGENTWGYLFRNDSQISGGVVDFGRQKRPER